MSGTAGAIVAVLRMIAVAVARVVGAQVHVGRRKAHRLELTNCALGFAVVIEERDDRTDCHCLFSYRFSSTTLPRKSTPTRTGRPSFVASACQIEFWSLCNWLTLV